MTRQSDGSIEREAAQLAAQRSAMAKVQAEALGLRVKLLEGRVTDLQHQLWDAQADNARLGADLHTMLRILANQGSGVAQSMLAALQPEAA